jgi:uncharacterized protein (TIGR02452 family)
VSRSQSRSRAPWPERGSTRRTTRLELPARENSTPAIEVTRETTAAAARRLVHEGEAGVVALNFASAKNPGGGFLGGARAQEEDLARCSALYVCQLQQRGYYDANRASGTVLYTDHLIYSPDVPFFRDDSHALLPAPFLVSLLTSPAPNAGEAWRGGEGERVHETLVRRARQVLAVAAHHRHRVIVLGAWGCGVFRNDPRAVAEVFAKLVEEPPFAGSFARVVFAVYDRSKAQATMRAFEDRFTAKN